MLPPRLLGLEPRSGVLELLAREGPGPFEIQGPLVKGVIVVPRSAMRNNDRLLIVDADNRLHRRPVEVLRIDRDDVIVRAELARGERVVVSPIQVVVEGMRVRPIAAVETGNS